MMRQFSACSKHETGVRLRGCVLGHTTSLEASASCVCDSDVNGGLTLERKKQRLFAFQHLALVGTGLTAAAQGLPLLKDRC